MDVRFGMAKTKKYAVSESGDTFEMVERPHGGLSFVLVDGQRSGKSAKRKSMPVINVQRATGVQDGWCLRK